MRTQIILSADDRLLFWRTYKGHEKPEHLIEIAIFDVADLTTR